MASRPLSKPPVSFSLGDEVPHIFIRESHQRPRKILIGGGKPSTRSRPQTRGTKCQESKNLGRIRGIPASTFLLNSPVRQESTAHGSVRCHPCGDAEQSGRTLQRRGSLRRCRATLQAGAGVNTKAEGEYPQFLDAFCLGLKEFGSARFCAGACDQRRIDRAE